jgi:hypothetical protein
MARSDRTKQLGLMLAVIVGLGLMAFAAINLFRSHPGGGGTAGGNVAVKRVALSEAPQSVREAAAQLAASKVGYVMPQGPMAYLIISAGPNGGGIDLAGAKRAGSIIDIDVRSKAGGDRVVIGLLQAPVADTRMVQFHLDGEAAGIPALINTDNLPLVSLPDKGGIVMVAPVTGERLAGTMVQVTGYARLYEGRFHATVYSAGKGRVLGESKSVVAATGSPNWGSFKVNIPVDVPQGMTDGVVLVYDEQTNTKVAVPVKFGSK